MRILLLSLVSGLALAPLAALAAEPPPAEQPVSTVQNSNKVTCYHSYYQGSLIKQPACQSDREMLRRRLEEQDAIHDIQLRALVHRQ